MSEPYYPNKDAGPRVDGQEWWCETHGRMATHVTVSGEAHCVGGGITIPCRCHRVVDGVVQRPERRWRTVEYEKVGSLLLPKTEEHWEGAYRLPVRAKQ